MVSVHTSAYHDMIEILKVQRAELGISQRSLAKKLNVSQSYISKIESCELRLDVIDYFNYASVLEINIDRIQAVLSQYIPFYNK